MEARIAQANALSQALLALVRERRGEDLETWMAEAANSGLEEFIRLARVLYEDLEAIKAGLSLGWSNGPLDRPIHRLKMLKRQGYGRAGFALLRQRVMRAG